ncbi:hypothetical protein LTR62_008829 [Meristemomyces frigidus]|uniref:Uncharacterized protein n=1 Tax=Meristemomyces frigidus TaxID=1508187 RepID=A0AAN7T9I4_9PEZI|nr:hypothetical protein LTR62_008829 [Meristemomyces frigidus]
MERLLGGSHRVASATDLARLSGAGVDSEGDEIFVRDGMKVTDRKNRGPTKLGGKRESAVKARVVLAELKIGTPVSARLVDGRTLVVKYTPITSADAIEKTAVDTDHAAFDAADEDVGGRNARGTYSREYTLKHPETTWVHRGQGRYLPAEEVKAERLAMPAPERTSRHSRGIPEPIKTEHSDPEAINSSTRPSRWRTSEGGRVPSFGRQVSSAHTPEEDEAPRARAIRNSLTDSLSFPPQYGLRQRQSEPSTPTLLDSRTARLSRRAKLVPSIERGRANERTNSHTAANDTDDDDNMEDDELTKTYTKEHVEAHPNEEFHHTGNGWYRRGPKPGPRPPQITSVKESDRSSDRLTKTRSRETRHTFDVDQTVHSTDLWKYPNQEFHHKGNGWYRPGPDPEGRRASKLGGPDDGRRSSRVVDHDARNNTPAASTAGTVDKAYADAHPEYKWEHRGNGRYVQVGSTLRKNSTKTTASSEAIPSTERRRSNSQKTYSQEHVKANPHLTFYHTGNARYKLGVKPQVIPAHLATETPEEELGMLYDKAYVLAHPHQNFHHRGRGCYARGPRPAAPRAAEEDSEEEEEEEEHEIVEPIRLVDKAYVDAHPHQNFHHRGQGRWAHGLPKLGSHHKTAVHGPGAKNWKLDNRISHEEEPEASDVPPIGSLMRKEDGPEKFPHLYWYYRGGGKHVRATKEEWELHAPKRPNSSVLSHLTKRRRIEGPSEHPHDDNRGVSVAGAEEDEDDDIDGDCHLSARHESKAKARRYRRHQVAPHEHGSKDTSNTHSQAPTPKPRMLEPEEDRISKADLPFIFRDYNSPEPSDPIEVLLRDHFLDLNGEANLLSLTKHDPAIRPTDSLRQLAEHNANTLKLLQNEFLELDHITAPHARIPRRACKGGRLPVDPQIFEDKKEADLYDYVFDPRRIGFQDPDAQKVLRDAEGRELRKRRRLGLGEDGAPVMVDVVKGWRWGDEVAAGLGGADGKRRSRQPPRYDGAGGGVLVGEEADGVDGGVAAGLAGTGFPKVKRQARNPTGYNGKMPRRRLPGTGTGTPSSRAASPANKAFLSAAGGQGRGSGSLHNRIQELRAGSEGSEV